MFLPSIEPKKLRASVSLPHRDDRNQNPNAGFASLSLLSSISAKLMTVIPAGVVMAATTL